MKNAGKSKTDTIIAAHKLGGMRKVHVSVTNLQLYTALLKRDSEILGGQISLLVYKHTVPASEKSKDTLFNGKREAKRMGGLIDSTTTAILTIVTY